MIPINGNVLTAITLAVMIAASTMVTISMQTEAAIAEPSLREQILTNHKDKLSIELYEYLNNTDIGTEKLLPLLVWVNVAEVESVENELPYDKMEEHETLREEIKQMINDSENGKIVSQAALDAKMQEYEENNARLAEEIREVRKQVIDSNRQKISGPVSEVAADFGRMNDVEIKASFYLIPIISIDAGLPALDRIAANPRVVEIGLESTMSGTLASSRLTINADVVHDHCCSSTTGAGTQTAVIDSGISGNSNVVVSSSKNCSTDSTVNDLLDHGTRVAGVIKSTHSTNKGIAYSTTLMNAKSLNSSNQSTDTTMMCAAQWAIDYGATIISHSIACQSVGDPVCGPPSVINGNSTSSKLIDWFVDKYLVFWVNSAGNYVGTYYPSYDKVARPGDAYNTLTVGAIDDNNSGNNDADDTLYELTRVPGTYEGRKKPEVVAPGEKITTTNNAGGFTTVDGTSFAVPHAAGVAALEESMNSALSAGSLRAVIVNSAVLYRNSGTFDSVSGWGYGRIDAESAWKYDSIYSSLISDGAHKYRYKTLDAGEEYAVTLTWNRHMLGSVGSTSTTVKALSNLDLFVYDPNGNLMTCGTCISDSNIDNIEVVYFTAPISGKYKFDIYAENVPSALSSQRFYLASPNGMSSS